MAAAALAVVASDATESRPRSPTEETNTVDSRSTTDTSGFSNRTSGDDHSVVTSSSSSQTVTQTRTATDEVELAVDASSSATATHVDAAVLSKDEVKERVSVLRQQGYVVHLCVAILD